MNLKVPNNMPAKISKDIEKNICDDYIANLSYKDIVIKYDIAQGTLHNILKRNNIQSHHPNQKETDFNCNFFDTYTAENCYWAGFILTDGYIYAKHNSTCIRLNNIDKNHLQNFINIINAKHKISCYSTIQKSGHISNMCQIRISSKQIVKSLEENFHIVPRKTPIVKWHKNIPKDFYKDFIRGLIDGDGSIGYRQEGMRIHFTCNNHLFAETVLNKIHENVDGGILTNRKKLSSLTKHKNNLDWNIYGQNAIKVAHWLYKDAPENCRLERKYQKYLELINKYDKNIEMVA